jgi:glycosyltransferase involved in cell wall biosynthesis
VGEPIQLLFVSRMSVRKGVEMIVALSHRLARHPGRYVMRIVGTGALFSDYGPLLEDLDMDVATYVGPRSPSELAALYREVDIVLQPSHYEPFALTVGEALSSGTPVVVSDAVGAGENLSAQCCRTFPAGDLDAMEAQVHALGSALKNDRWRQQIKGAARLEAERRFAPDIVCEALRGVFASVVSSGPRR